MSLRRFLLLMLVLLPFFNVFAQRNIKHCCEGHIQFIENKNQWDKHIRFKTELTGTSIFYETDAFTFAFEDRKAVNELLSYKQSSPEEKKSKAKPDSLVNYHAYKMRFVNSSKDVKISGSHPTPDYVNYFIGDDPSRWASEVTKYTQIAYSNLYEGIDLEVYNYEHLLKYDFIVNPGADYRDIILEYEGHDKISITPKGHLNIKTSVNDVTEVKPYAYQLIDGDTIEIPVSFKLRKNRVTFDVESAYNKNHTLVIDPTLIFSTYSGSTIDNWGYTATYDYEGFVYAAGIAMGMGYPTTIGAYQVVFGGPYCDISITKYDTLGSTLRYSTYLGGSGPEIPHSIFVNNNNELFVFGTSGSPNFPTTTGAYDNTFNGGTAYTMTYVIQYTQGSDIIVSRLNANGTALLASTYIGGSGNDGLSSAPPLRYNYADEARGEVFLDDNNNCWIASSTQSLNFPVTPNAFQTTFGGGQQDGLILCMDNSLSTMIWGSYIGGSGNDAVYSITIDDNDGNIYVAGGTSSTNFPTTIGAYKTTYQGGSSDGFISKIHKNGNNILHSTYFGSNAYDQIYFVERDKLGFVYIFGQTQATGNTLIYNALWNTPNGGQFITKLEPQLDTIVWSTAFGTGGGVPNISPTAFLVDLCNNIYLSGWGGAVNGFGGTSGLPITTNAFQTTTNNSDFYLLVITDDASSLVYGSYFGGAISNDHVDGGTSRFDKKGIIYQAMCAGCGGQDDTPTTPGAWSQTNNSSNCNNAVFKMDFGLPVTIANFNSPPILCAPATVNFVNTSTTTSGTGVTSYWTFGNGQTSTQYHPSTTYTQSGIYTVTLVVTDQGSCNFSDTMVRQIVILSNTIDTLPPDTICFGDFTQIGVPPLPSPNTTYTWLPGTALSQTNVPNPIASPLVTTQYMLLISNGVCTDTLYQRVVVDNLTSNAGNNVTVCEGSVSLQATSNQTGVTYQWSSNNMFTDTLNVFPNPGLTTNVNQTSWYYVLVKNQNCVTRDSVRVTVSQVNISASQPQTICQGQNITINATNLIPSNPVTYVWQPSSSIVSGGNSASPIVAPQTNTTYTVTATDQYGCTASASVAVTVTLLQSSHVIVNPTCYGYCNGSISVTPLGGTVPYSYNWNNGQTVPLASNLCAGPYSLTITDLNNCTLVTSYNVLQPPPLVITIIDTVHVLCNGICDGSITVAASGGTSPYVYNWVSGQLTPQISGLCAGIYTISVSDAQGCSTSLPVEIKDTSSFAVSPSIIHATCYDTCNGIIHITGTGGVQPYSYQWSNGGNSMTQSNLCFGTYNVTVTESAGCIRNVFATVQQPPALTLQFINVQNPTCNGFCDGQAEAVAGGGTPPYSFTWSHGPLTAITNTLCDGVYYVTVTDSNFCTITASVTLEEPTPLVLDLTAGNVPCIEVCNGAAIATPTGSTPPYTYVWSDGQTSGSAAGLCAGLYSLTVYDANGCNLSDTITVHDTTYFPLTIVTYASKDTIYSSQSVQLFTTQLGSGFSYSWHPASTLNNPTIHNPIASPTQTTTYYVEITDQWGCVLKDSVIVVVLEVICDDSNIFIPNAFSPNADNNNDVLFVRGKVIDQFYLTVYNRWGEMVFETRQLDKGWDGLYKGKMSEPGVYVYYLEVICIDKQEFFKKGNITLLR